MYCQTLTRVQMTQFSCKVKSHGSEAHIYVAVCDTLFSSNLPSSLLPQLFSHHYFSYFIGLWAFFTTSTRLLHFKQLNEYQTRRNVIILISIDIVPYLNVTYAECPLNLICHNLWIKSLKVVCIFTIHIFFSFPCSKLYRLLCCIIVNFYFIRLKKYDLPQALWSSIRKASLTHTISVFFN